jgi:hypothetical protein
MAPEAHGAQVLPDPEFRTKNMIRPTKTDPPYNFCFIHFFPSLTVEAVDALQTLFRAPPDPDTHTHTHTHSHTHTDSPLYIRLETRLMTDW